MVKQSELATETVSFKPFKTFQAILKQNGHTSAKKTQIKTQAESKHMIQQIYSKQTFEESNHKFMKNQSTSVLVKYYNNCVPLYQFHVKV